VNDVNNVFLSGEKIDLCVPMDDDFDTWAGWFNSQKITQFLEQGKFPNTPRMQRQWYEKEVSLGRFIALIKDKHGVLLGVTSLSEINYEKLSCQISTVCPVKSDHATLAPLEARALCTEHAFERFGMNRVWAGNAYPGLLKWLQKYELIGYRTEGFEIDGFRHGSKKTNSVRSSITRERYSLLLELRGGSLWPGEEKANRMLAALRSQTPLAQRVEEAIKALHLEHDDFLAQIEIDT